MVSSNFTDSSSERLKNFDMGLAVKGFGVCIGFMFFPEGFCKGFFRGVRFRIIC